MDNHVIMSWQKRIAEKCTTLNISLLSVTYFPILSAPVNLCKILKFCATKTSFPFNVEQQTFM
jgi:hypothetical protein